MITKVLARIASHTAKGIFSFLMLNGGCACRKELIDAGYSSNIIHKALVELEVAGLVLRVGGLYRVTIDGNNVPTDGKTPNVPTGGNNVPTDGKTEVILESLSNRKITIGGKNITTGGKKVPTGGKKCDSDVNVVNVINKQTNKPCEINLPSIKSTAEIPGHIDENTFNDNNAFVKQCKIIKEMLGSIPQLSDDLVIRIVGAERWTGAKIPLDTLHIWKNEAHAAFKKGNVKSPYIALSNHVKRWYVNAGIKWTKCRPNTLRDIDKKLFEAKKNAFPEKETHEERSARHKKILDDAAAKFPNKKGIIKFAADLILPNTTAEKDEMPPKRKKSPK
jgi:hypothetical protein